MKMKKAMAMIVCISMAAAISACGAQETGNSTKAGSGTVQESGDMEARETDTKEEAKSMDKKDVPEGLNHEYIDQIYGFKFWVSTMNGTYNDVGSSYRFSKNTEGDRADLFIMKYTVLGAYTDAEICDLTQIKSSKDIFEAMKGKFKQDILTPGIETDIQYQNLETSTINGVEMTKFEGNYVEDWGGGSTSNFAFAGYQILAKNRPIMVFVVEKEPSDDNSNIDQFNDMLDDIVSTFEDEEGGTKEPGYLE